MFTCCVSERSKKHLQLDLKCSLLETHIWVILVYPFCTGPVITIAPKQLKFQPEESKFCQRLNRIDCTKNTYNEAIAWIHLDQEVHQYYLLPQPLHTEPQVLVMSIWSQLQQQVSRKKNFQIVIPVLLSERKQYIFRASNPNFILMLCTNC